MANVFSQGDHHSFTWDKLGDIKAGRACLGDSMPDQLFEYLRDMLYAPAKASLDSATMPEEYRELAEGLRLVARYLDETRAYGLALSAGDFSVKQPRGENAIAAPHRAA